MPLRLAELIINFYLYSEIFEKKQNLNTGNTFVMKLKAIKPESVVKNSNIQINESHFLKFKEYLKEDLIDKINEKEREENAKNFIKPFLDNSFYNIKDDKFKTKFSKHLINTKGDIDLVIHNGEKADTSVGVLIEAKRPKKTSEFPSLDNINVKAMHELILYYMHERLGNEKKGLAPNKDIKHLIITNGFEWFIFDVNIFYKYFYDNKKFKKEFENWSKGLAEDKNNPYFYNEIAPQLLTSIDTEIEVIHFNLLDYKEYLNNDNEKDNEKLAPLYELFMPNFLLKKDNGQDSNSLDKNFYKELLHIIGLKEVTDGGKVLIKRLPTETRNAGSLLENAIAILESEDCLSQVKKSEYGTDKEEQLFNVALELIITWINRTLFIKLLEGQLISYHNNDSTYKFFNYNRIQEYDTLNKLFFQVLAVKESERRDIVKKDFPKIPYLNSSLFEPNTLERATMKMSNLEDEYEIPLHSNTVLKDKKSSTMKTLQYLLEFLDAYNFSSVTKGKIQKDDKTLINASVLGTVFEKINGYKEGSFYTPGYITMYMSRETIRKAVVQKFKEKYTQEIETFEELKNFIGRPIKTDILKEYNELVNSIKIVDPAVGSGHFLVSALNELIAIKSELNILTDYDNNRLDGYICDISKDELIISDVNDEIFSYHLNDKNNIIPELQKVQKALFHEKQTIIENCLFGVDINPNSAKICRLRLWIELLKNAYYTDNSGRDLKSHPELQTLPNIDINIKVGNSLISRFELDMDIKKALRGTKWTIFSYQNAVQAYKNTTNKETKRKLNQLIDDIKNNFKTQLRQNDPIYVKLSKLKSKFYDLFSGGMVFEPQAPYGKSDPEKERKQKEKEMAKEIETLETQVEEMKNSHIYHNAFEWRFEFPEVLDENGKFLGFDVVIGNPPYVDIKALDNDFVKYVFDVYHTGSNRINLYGIFVEKALSLMKNNAEFGFIIPNSILMNSSYALLRELVIDKVNKIVKLPDNVFDEANVETIILMFTNKQIENAKVITYKHNEVIDKIQNNKQNFISKYLWRSFDSKFNLYITTQNISIIEKSKKETTKLDELCYFSLGITPYDKYKGHSSVLIKNKAFHSKKKLSEEYKPLITGENIRPYFVDETVKGFIKYGDWLGAKREERFFTDERIIIRQIASGKPPKIYAGYSNSPLYFTQIGFAIIPKESKLYNVKYLISLLNSKYINYIHRYLFLDIEKEVFQKVLIENAKQIPIKRISADQQQPFIGKVNEILTLKKANPAADTAELEHEIDLMVYALYGLSEEEVAIVEGG